MDPTGRAAASQSLSVRSRRCSVTAVSLRPSFQRLAELTVPPTSRPARRPISVLSVGPRAALAAARCGLALGSAALLGEVGVEPHEAQDERDRADQHPTRGVDRPPGLERQEGQDPDHDEVERSMQPPTNEPERTRRPLGDGCVEDDQQPEQCRHSWIGQLDRGADRARSRPRTRSSGGSRTAAALARSATMGVRVPAPIPPRPFTRPENGPRPGSTRCRSRAKKRDGRRSRPAAVNGGDVSA